MQTCKLFFEVTYNPAKTSPAKLAELLDFMIGQALQTNVLDDEGYTEVGTVTSVCVALILHIHNQRGCVGEGWNRASSPIPCNFAVFITPSETGASK